VSQFARTLRALPTLLRVGVAETVAYRAEFIVWILTTTQPLIMMGLWTAVARDGKFGAYTPQGFTAYFLATLLVRQLTGNWVAWQMGEEVRMGTMSMRLLRPIHPFFAFAASHVAAIPFRSVVAIPIGIALLASTPEALTHDPLQLALLPVSLALAWLLTFVILFAFGTLSFWLTQTFAIVNLYFGVYSLFSGYLMPLDLLPGPLANIAGYLPFRFMLSAPVEILTRQMDHDHLAFLLGGQAAWTGVMLATALAMWRAGIKRFEAVGA
jgi:ABC-2 type transport system permease protein